MADLDFLKYFKPADLVTPMSVGMEMANKRENEKTQRMFAQNSANRESAQALRESQEFKNKLDEQKRQHGIEDANAVQTIGMLNMTNPGAAAALAAAHGGYLNPLTATTPAAHSASAPSFDAQLDDALGGGPSSSGAAEPSPAAAAPPAPVYEGPQESPELEDARAAKPDAGLESLMARSIPPTVVEGSREEAPRAPAPNPLMEVVMGGQHYPLPTTTPGTGLGDKYDKIYHSLTSTGAMSQQDALKHVAGLYSDDNKASTTEERMLKLLGGRNDQQDKTKAEYSLTADQKLQIEKDREANAVRTARIRAAANSPGIDPKAQAFLAKALEMSEGGASDHDIALAGAAAHVDPKVWTGQVNAEDRKANADLRSTERRAGLDVTDENGNSLGPAKSSQLATIAAKQEPAWAQLKSRYQALIDDVKENGTRINPADIAAVQRRESLFNLAQGAARQYNGFGNTDASQKLEHSTMAAAGTLGNGIVMGANADVLQHLLDEAGAQHGVRLKSYLRVGGGSPLPPVVTHKKTPADSDKYDEMLDFARGLPGARR